MRTQYCREHIDDVAEACGLDPSKVAPIKRATEFADEHPLFMNTGTEVITQIQGLVDPDEQAEVILEFEKWLEIGNVTRIKQEAFNSGVALVRSRRFYDKQRTLSADRAETLRAYNEKMALVRKDQAAQKRIDDKKIAEQKAIDDAARKAREDALKVELEKLAKKKGIEAAEKARAKAAAVERTRAAEEERKLKEQEEAAKKAREEKMDPALKELTRLNEVIQSLTTRQEKLYLQIVVHVEIVEAATAERKRAEEKEKAAIGYLNQLRKEQDACVKELLHTAGLMKKIKGGN